MPTPPLTINAPVFDEPAWVLLVIIKALVVELPLFVTLCKLSTDVIVTAPVDVDTLMPDPPVMLVTP